MPQNIPTIFLCSILLSLSACRRSVNNGIQNNAAWALSTIWFLLSVLYSLSAFKTTVVFSATEFKQKINWVVIFFSFKRCVAIYSTMLTEYIRTIVFSWLRQVNNFSEGNKRMLLKCITGNFLKAKIMLCLNQAKLMQNITLTLLTTVIHCYFPSFQLQPNFW